MTSARKAPSKRPLAGERILITRARGQAEALASRLRALGAQTLEIPVIEIRSPRSYKPLDAALRKAAEYDWLILTSVNGVRALFERLARLRLGAAHLRHLHIAAIGPATKAEIESHGLKVDVVPQKYVAESVVRSLRQRVKGKRVLLVRARVARDVIPAELRRTAARVDVREAYQTILPRSARARLLAALGDVRRRPTVITFTSSSTARHFVQLMGAEKTYCGLLDGIYFASIGPVTSSTLRELNLPVHVEANEYTIPGLVKALAAAARAQKRS